MVAAVAHWRCPVNALLFVLGVALGFLLTLAVLSSRTGRPRTLPPEVIAQTAAKYQEAFDRLTKG